MGKKKTQITVRTEDKSKFLGLTAVWWVVVIMVVGIPVSIWLAFRDGGNGEKQLLEQRVEKLQADKEELYSLLHQCLGNTPIILDKDNPPPEPDCFDTVEIEVRNIIEQGGYVNGADLLRVGNVLYTKGDCQKALSYYQVALNQAGQHDDSSLIASAKGNIGLIYSDKGDLDEALKYHQAALEIHKEVGYRQGKANQLGNIGLIYKAKGDLDEALKYLKEALEIFEAHGYTKEVEQTKRNIAEIERMKNE